MADIELVIKIPDEEYKKICLMSKDGIGMALYDWIANGTPLPKGHGDLIDIQPLMRGLYEEMSVGELTYTTSEVYKMLEEECPVIIEADKENKKMKDTVFELYDKCPKCGKSKGLYYSMQYPLAVNKTLNGKTFVKTNGKRVTRISNRRKAFMFDQAQYNFELAKCVCEFCGWESEPITQ